MSHLLSAYNLNLSKEVLLSIKILSWTPLDLHSFLKFKLRYSTSSSIQKYSSHNSKVSDSNAYKSKMSFAIEIRKFVSFSIFCKDFIALMHYELHVLIDF